ncbi:6-phosphogluconate dehydrogenase [Salmonella enterica subsp. houtenae]|nr:6-phosphogluconate dehydrogenase [Salmonella enterica subsp. houtenae]
MSKQQIGVVGMAVMGRNLALNIESRGYTVSVFNRSREKTEEVIAENPGKRLVPYYTVKEFVESLETPRRILLMVKAGAGTDAAIDSLKPYLEKGDIIMTAATPSSRTRSVAIASCLRKVLTLSAPVFPVAKRAR